MSISNTNTLKHQKQVPADLRIVVMQGTVMVDNAALTGESLAQKRSTEMTNPNALETKNLAFFGTSVVKGSLWGIAVATGDRTVMGRIAALASSTENEESPIGKEIHHFVLIVSSVAFVLGVTFFSVGFALGTDIITNLVFMIGIIVANVRSSSCVSLLLSADSIVMVTPTFSNTGTRGSACYCDRVYGSHVISNGNKQCFGEKS